MKTKQNYITALNTYYSGFDYTELLKILHNAIQVRKSNVTDETIMEHYTNNTIGQLISEIDPEMFEQMFDAWDGGAIKLQ